jgi:Zn-dependent protease with chaperone function
VGEIAIRQAILHGIVAAGFVEALLRTWKMGCADARIRFWMLALAFPLLVAPLFLAALPLRSTDWFAGRWALFASARWNAVRLAGIGVDTLVFAVLVAAGLALFLRDAVPLVVDAWRERRDDAGARVDDVADLGALVADLSHALRILPPAVTIVAADARVFFVRGLLNHRLVVSHAVLAHLDGPRLRAAVAHELAHVARRDPLAGWLLMAARLAMCWNPAVQLLARAIVQEMERRADQAAAALTAPEHVTEALRRLAAPAARTTRRSGMPLRTLTEHLDGAHIRARAAALLAPAARETSTPARLTLAGVGLGVLLFFVV